MSNKKENNNTNSKNNVNVVNVLGKVFNDGTMIETIYDPLQEKLQFLVKKTNSTSYYITPELLHGSHIYKPIDDGHVLGGKIQLTKGYKEISDKHKLLEDIQRFIHNYVELEPGFEAIAARYVLMTWVYERFEKVPYLRIIGPWGSGKSRFLDIMHALCYHSTNLGEGITPANIYRWLDKYPGTLILDEADFFETNTTSAITQILNGGYKRGGGVTRCVGKNFEAERYSSFGPKILASRIPYSDDALESRLLTGNSIVKTRKDIPTALSDMDSWEEVDELRKRLLGFRLEYYQAINTDLLLDSLTNFEPRLTEILLPLFQVTGEEVITEDIFNFLNEQNEDRFALMNFSEEGVVAKAVLEIFSRNPNENLTIKQLTEIVNQIGNFRHPLSYRRVGSLIRAIGLTSRKTNIGYSVQANLVQLRQLSRRYGLTEYLK